MPRKILFLSTCVRGGGAGWSLYALLKNLDRSRFEPLVAYPRSGIFQKLYSESEIRTMEVSALPERMSGAGSLVRDLFGLARGANEIARLASRQKVDLVYCNNMLTKPVGWAAAGIANRPVVFHCRNIHDTTARSIFYPMLARSERVRKVICNSEASRRPYAKWVGPKTVVVHNGVDIDRFGDGIPPGRLRSEFGVGKGTPVIGYFGNLIPRKGPDVLLEATAHLLRRFPRAQVFFVGDKPIGSDDRFKRGLAQRSQELGIGRSIHFIGAVPDIRPYLRDVVVAVVPSVQEPFGRVVIEAMAMGVPVVGSAVGGIPEIIQSGANGVLVPPRDPVLLAKAVADLLDDPEGAARMAREGLATVRTRFSAPVIARQIEAVLDSI